MSKPENIGSDLACECGYNLRGLSPVGRCPECGSPVSDAIRIRDASAAIATQRPGPSLDDANSRSIRAWIEGLACPPAGFVLMTLVPFAPEWAQRPHSWERVALLTTSATGWIIGWFGIWKLGTFDQSFDDGDSAKMAAAIRMMSIVVVTLPAAEICRTTFRPQEEFFLFLEFLIGIAYVVATVLAHLRMARLALAIRRPEIARLLSIMAIASGFAAPWLFIASATSGAPFLSGTSFDLMACLESPVFNVSNIFWPFRETFRNGIDVLDAVEFVAVVIPATAAWAVFQIARNLVRELSLRQRNKVGPGFENPS